ncbi:MAG: formylglycine-generating enzyme family protein [Alphaproteobacteria bacterium]|nr:MAG: formylglycine-generating enzyme family protein [Alphaproteobacteria bacterium]HMC26347.1 SUMF1/EgtB/PvdO family nonheme iron enzyme [Verrucomicrobiae bacterium]
MTFDEWDACIAATGCSYRPSDQNWGRGKQPVLNISWDDAKEYVGWLSRKTGRSYRLLSEAEREYVTRAGTSSAYWWGDNFTALQANSAYQIDHSQPMSAKTVPVNSFSPNPWGFFQVHGNVYDWVEDCENDNYKLFWGGEQKFSGMKRPVRGDVRDHTFLGYPYRCGGEGHGRQRKKG